MSLQLLLHADQYLTLLCFDLFDHLYQSCLDEMKLFQAPLHNGHLNFELCILNLLQSKHLVVEKMSQKRYI